MKSTNIKRSIVLNGRKTSVSLEKEFWEGLREIANLQKAKLSALVRQIDQGRGGANLSSAIRVFVFNYFHTHCAGEQPAMASRRDPPGSIMAAAAIG
jgi:predicted DNA-binding ribbon-helix-helix protein